MPLARRRAVAWSSRRMGREPSSLLRRRGTNQAVATFPEAHANERDQRYVKRARDGEHLGERAGGVGRSWVAEQEHEVRGLSDDARDVGRNGGARDDRN